MNRLVLIDGNAILHRAYHALPPLTAPDGSLVNAVYGFTSMLIKIFHDLKPTHIAVAFDRAAPTFRKKMFKEYQAQRPKMEDELIGQVAKVHDVVAAFGIPTHEVDGFEADDVIGTIAKRAKEDTRILRYKDTKSKEVKTSHNISVSQYPNIQIIIVTGDKDLLQLVDDNTFLYMPTKGLSEAKLFDEAAVRERMGVAPAQIPDFKALAGDPSDNYPGVSGIGPKTAAELLDQFKTLGDLYRAVEKKDKKITPPLVEKLTQGKESADMSKQLATIRTDAPVEIDLEKSKVTTLDTPEARKALEDLHFPSLLKRLSAFQMHPKSAKSKKTEAKKEDNLNQLSLV